MDRHRGDRYGGDYDDYSSNSTTPSAGGYNQDSYYNRRPSRFSDGPPSRFSDGPPSRFSDGPPSQFSDGPPSRFTDGPPSRFTDGPPSRFSDGPGNRYPDNGSRISDDYSLRSPNNYRGDRGHRPFDSPPRRSPVGGTGGGFRPMGGSGGGFRPMAGAGGDFSSNYQAPLPPTPSQPLAGQKRGFGGRGGSPDLFDGSSFAKLFVGSVPRTVTELDIRPVFEEHGNVIEVALIKDKRTGQQQGCCFIKYATSAEADRAIRALHNQYMLPGGVGPIQVRYADGERERLGAVEYKLFVGSLNKQATEKEVEEIFSPYGRVEDVYLMRDEMRQSRGCGFVKYSGKDMALAAINALNGTFTMRGCDQPLTVRFADPKRPRPGDSRGSPAFGGPGSAPQFQAPGPRPLPNYGDPMGDRDRIPSNAWHPMSPQNLGPSTNTGVHGMGGQLPPRSGDLALPLNQGGPIGGPADGVPPGPVVSSAQQQFPSVSQQMISPLQKPLQSPQHLPPSLPLHGQVVTSYSHTQAPNVNQFQPPRGVGQTPFGQTLPSQHMAGFSGQSSTSQPQFQHGAPSSTALQAPPSNANLQLHSMSAGTNQLPMPTPMQHQPLQPLQQSSQLAQMLSQQKQNLQATFSQLQQQLQMIQPTNQNLAHQQNSQNTKLQWPGTAPPTFAGTATTLPADVPTATAMAASAAHTVAPMKCNWTEHTSPEGFKYYYNSTTHESRWEKPEELALFEQQQQVPKPSLQQPQNQSNPQVQQAPQLQLQPQNQAHLQPQFRHQQQLQQPSFSSPGLQATQEWAWKNKPAGA